MRVSPENMRSDSRIARKAAVSAKPMAQYDRQGRHENADSKGNHGEADAGAPHGNDPEQEAEEQAGDASEQRRELHGKGNVRRGEVVERVHREVGAKTIIDRVAERQQARLAEQDIVG